MKARYFLAVVAALGACTAPVQEDKVAVTSEAVTPPARTFGAHCQDAYDNNWVTWLGWTVCDRFVTEASKKATKQFYYNLHGKAYYWEDSGDQATNSLESVDLFYSNTHGGSSMFDSADFGMWDDGTSDWSKRALTRDMRLGDEGHKLSIFAIETCDVMKWSSEDLNNNGISDTWERWDSVFKGGLLAALGSHGLVYGNSNDGPDDGKVFAQYINAGYTLKDSWYYSLSYSASDNDVAVMFAGTSGTHCNSRRDTMTWDNFTSASRVRDSSMTSLCIWYWDNV